MFRSFFGVFEIVEVFALFLKHIPDLMFSAFHDHQDSKKDPIGDVFSSNVEQIMDVIFVLNWYKFQELSCGGGYNVLNDLRN